jgi:glycosyltransferase involved in cell wall biosynthesis
LPILSQLDLVDLMDKELFEVFLGTFNAESWIEQVISSLEAQDCAPFKVKIIDNASTDNTIALIEDIFSRSTFKNDYTLLKNNRNIEAISSFLDRLNEFDCEWIVMVHQDDIYHPDHIGTLSSAMRDAKRNTGVLFTAMKRIDGEGNTKISPPTISSKLSKTDRLENFMLSLQLSPVNFPACALRVSELRKTNTSRHTNAFNDIEMLLRIMCVSDVSYIPRETMHYRVYPGNAAAITSSFANDRAVFVGLVELFHSEEVAQVLSLAKTSSHWIKLIASINQAIEIRIQDTEIQNLARNIIAETLVRRYGYHNREISSFLVTSLTSLGLTHESEITQNLHLDSSYLKIDLQHSDEVSGYKVTPPLLGKKPLICMLNDLVPLPAREVFFDGVFRSRLLSRVKRPFVRVWRLRGPSD